MRIGRVGTVQITVNPLTLAPHAYGDATIRGGAYGGNNFGTDADLILKNDASGNNDRDVHLRFVNGTGVVPSKATLVLTPSALDTGAQDMTLRVRLAPDADDYWEQPTITWNNAF